MWSLNCIECPVELDGILNYKLYCKSGQLHLIVFYTNKAKALQSYPFRPGIIHNYMPLEINCRRNRTWRTADNTLSIK